MPPTTRSSSYEPQEILIPQRQSTIFFRDGQQLILGIQCAQWVQAMTTYQNTVTCAYPGALGGCTLTLVQAQRQSNYTLTSEVDEAVVEVYNWSRLVYMAGLEEFNRSAVWPHVRPVFDPAWIPMKDIPEEARAECRREIIEYTK